MGVRWLKSYTVALMQEGGWGWGAEAGPLFPAPVSQGPPEAVTRKEKQLLVSSHPLKAGELGN